jgi:hypothetical protein
MSCVNPNSPEFKKILEIEPNFLLAEIMYDKMMKDQSYKIYDDISDIINTTDEPVFAFSNHIGQRYGIEFRSFSKGALYDGENLRGSSLEIDFDCLK